MFEEFEKDYLNETIRQIVKLKYKEYIEVLESKVAKLEDDIIKIRDLNIKNDPTTDYNIIPFILKYKDLMEVRLTFIADLFPETLYEYCYKYLVKNMVLNGYKVLVVIAGNEGLKKENLNSLSEPFGTLILERLKKEVEQIFGEKVTLKINDVTLKTFQICVEVIYYIQNSDPEIRFINTSNDINSKTEYQSDRYQLWNGTVRVIETVIPGLVVNNYVIVRAHVNARYLEIHSMSIKSVNEVGKKENELFQWTKEVSSIEDSILIDILNYTHWDATQTHQLFEILRKLIAKNEKK